MTLRLIPFAPGTRVVPLGLRFEQTVELWEGGRFLGRLFVKPHRGGSHRMSAVFELANEVRVQIGPAPNEDEREAIRRHGLARAKRSSVQRAGYFGGLAAEARKRKGAGR